MFILEFAEKTSLKPSTKTGQKDVQKTAAPLAAPKDAKEIAKQLIASGVTKNNLALTQLESLSPALVISTTTQCYYHILMFACHLGRWTYS